MTTPPPATIALCPKCRRHVVFNDWCYGCGFKGVGVVYVRKESERAEA